MPGTSHLNKESINYFNISISTVSRFDISFFDSLYFRLLYLRLFVCSARLLLASLALAYVYFFVNWVDGVVVIALRVALLRLTLHNQAVVTRFTIDHALCRCEGLLSASRLLLHVVDRVTNQTANLAVAEDVGVGVRFLAICNLLDVLIPLDHVFRTGIVANRHIAATMSTLAWLFISRGASANVAANCRRVRLGHSSKVLRALGPHISSKLG